MSSRHLVALRASVREKLRDEDPLVEKWSDGELDGHIFTAVREVSEILPRQRKTALGATLNSKEVDISDLPDFISIDVDEGVEYKINLTPPRFRDWTWIKRNELLRMKLSFDPTATSKGTLTGTITFTLNSTAITGSGTAFDTELAAGDFIRKSDGYEWYKVESIESADAVTLATPSNDDGTDTADSTLYGSDPIYIRWGQAHTLNTEESSLTAMEERLVINGAEAYALISWGLDKVNAVNIGGVNVGTQILNAGNGKLWKFMGELERKKLPRPVKHKREGGA